MLLLAASLVAASLIDESIPTEVLHDVAEDGLEMHGDGAQQRVAVCITLLNEGPESLMFIDGAAVLAHSLKRTNSVYFFDFYAIVTPAVTKSRASLRAHGYTILDGQVRCEPGGTAGCTTRRVSW